jgi:hypothetical protein
MELSNSIINSNSDSNSNSPPYLLINPIDNDKESVNYSNSSKKFLSDISNSLLRYDDFKRGDDLSIRSIKGLSSSIRENSSLFSGGIKNSDYSFKIPSIRVKLKLRKKKYYIKNLNK